MDKNLNFKERSKQRFRVVLLFLLFIIYFCRQMKYEMCCLDEQIGHAIFIPDSGGVSSTQHMAIAFQDTAIVLAPGRGLLCTVDHVIGGKLSCIDCTSDKLALGVGSYGYGALGNKVRTKNW